MIAEKKKRLAESFSLFPQPCGKLPRVAQLRAQLTFRVVVMVVLVTEPFVEMERKMKHWPTTPQRQNTRMSMAASLCPARNRAASHPLSAGTGSGRQAAECHLLGARRAREEASTRRAVAIHWLHEAGTIRMPALAES